MHPVTRRSSILTLVRFGFGHTPVRLFVRLDSDDRLADLLAEGYTFSLKFLRPAAVRFSVRMVGGQVAGTFWDRIPETNSWMERGLGGAAVAAGTILEMALPLSQLPTDARVAFFVVVSDRDHTEVEAHPAHHPIDTAIPDEQFEARNWTA